MLMIAPTGSNLPVPTRRRHERVEHTARSESQTGHGRRRGPAPAPAAAQGRTSGAPETAFKAPAGAIANTSTLVQLQTYPRVRGLRADETERRRYREAYARAGSSETGPALGPRLERSA